jgi:hypothetical protein
MPMPRVTHRTLIAGHREGASVSLTDATAGIHAGLRNADASAIYSFTARTGERLHVVHAVYRVDSTTGRHSVGRYYADDVTELYELTDEALQAARRLSRPLRLDAA